MDVFSGWRWRVIKTYNDIRIKLAIVRKKELDVGHIYNKKFWKPE